MTVDLAAGDLLGDAALPAAELSSLVSAAVGHPAAIADWHAESVPYQSGSPATGALARVRGITLDGQPWSLFVKVLQHPRHWRLLNQVPDEVREDFLANFPWRAELSAWEPSFAGRLPAGLRVPSLYLFVELPGEPSRCVDGRHRSQRRGLDCGQVPDGRQNLGTLAANRRDPDLLAASPVPPGYGLRRYFDGAVQPALSSLRSHDLWRHPRIAGNGHALRAGPLELAARARPSSTGSITGRKRCPMVMPARRTC